MLRRMTSLDAGARRAILDAADSLRDETLDWLFRLVRCPSTLGNEASALNEMVRMYRHLGLSPQRVPTVPGKLEGHPGFSPPLVGYVRGIDENVGIESIHNITRTIALTLAEWCGVEAAPDRMASQPKARSEA
ncbi:MAG: peptidase [Rubritepida sp.]|nr:peptidase [Rubritepida sp.]